MPETPRSTPPLLWPATALACGIAVDDCWPIPVTLAMVLLCAGAVSTLIVRRRTPAIAGLVLAAGAAGALRHDASVRHAVMHDARHMWPAEPATVTIEGRVVDVRPFGDVPDEYQWRAPRQGCSILVDLERGWAAEGPRRLSGLLRVHTAAGPSPARGACIRVRGQVVEAPNHSPHGPRIGRLQCPGPPALAVVRNHDHGLLQRLIWRARRRASQAVTRGLSDKTSDLQQAILLGRRTLLDNEQIRPFRRTGLAHVLALSGMHIGLIAGTLWMATRCLHIRRRFAAALITVILLCYGAVIEAQPSAIRALILVVIGCTGIVGRRVPNSLNSLCAAALVILAVQPDDLFGAGFQLSFVVTGGIILGLPRVNACLKPRGKAARPTAVHAALRRALTTVATTACISGVAWLAGAPLIAAHFGTVHPYGAALAVVFVPVIALALVAGFAKLAVGMVSEHAAACLAAPVELATRTGGEFVEWLEQLPGCAVSVAAPSWPWIAVYYTTLLIMLCPPPRGERAMLCGGLATLCLLTCVQWCDRTVRVTALPGGGVVINAAGAVTAVDIGDAYTGRRAATVLRLFLNDSGYPAPRRFIATAGECSRFNAAHHLLDTGVLGETWLCGHLLERLRPGARVTHLVEHCAARGVMVHTATAGTALPIRGIDARVVWPRADMPPGCSTADRALIILLQGPEHSALIAGAVTRYTAQALAEEGIRADVIIMTRPDTSMMLDPRGLQTLGVHTVVFNEGDRTAPHDITGAGPVVRVVNSAERGYTCALR